MLRIIGHYRSATKCRRSKAHRKRATADSSPRRNGEEGTRVTTNHHHQRQNTVGEEEKKKILPPPFSRLEGGEQFFGYRSGNVHFGGSGEPETMPEDPDWCSLRILGYAGPQVAWYPVENDF
nr:hypothetical protein Iba_chr13cCG15310 [Ipomoea batatas]